MAGPSSFHSGICSCGFFKVMVSRSTAGVDVAAALQIIPTLVDNLATSLLSLLFFKHIGTTTLL